MKLYWQLYRLSIRAPFSGKKYFYYFRNLGMDPAALFYIFSGVNLFLLIYLMLFVISLI